MKYKSELLSELIEKNGHATTKIPHYESECENEFINEVRGAYPKLCDYSGEWLNYANNHVNIGKFPTERVVNVTNARFENVVPYGYKSAILSGNTLVNLAQSTNLNGEYVFRDNFENLNFPCNMIKPSTTYTIISNIIENSANFLNLEWNTALDECAFKEIIRTDGSLGIRKFKVTSKDDLSNASISIRFFPNNKQENGTLTITFMILEGDYTNIDIPPYFEGMQSVKMPVLTTTGKNLWNENDWSKGLTSSTGVVQTGGTFDGFRYNNTLISVSGIDKIYCRTFAEVDVIGSGFRVAEYDSQRRFLRIIVCVSKSYTISKDCEYVRIHFDMRCNNGAGSQVNPSDDVPTFGMVSTSPITEYEPYKSNILSTSDDVELRGIGDVKDELNCLTGEVVEHFNVVTVNGNENWSTASTSDDTLMRFYTTNIIGYPNGEIICDKFNSFKTNMTNREGVVLWNSSGNLNIVVSKSKLTEESTNGFKQYLSNNPLTVQYQLTTESIKTVDLSCLDENNNPTKFKPYEGVMNVVTSSETLPPLLDMEVPVEAISQNLSGFIK